MANIAGTSSKWRWPKRKIRLMPWPNIDPLPGWYRTSGARRANKTTDKVGAIWQPDFSDPLYLKYWGELVAVAGRRYDGNPTLDTLDISSVGYWGEGWRHDTAPKAKVTFCFVPEVIPSNAPRVRASLRHHANALLLMGQLWTGYPYRLARERSAIQHRDYNEKTTVKKATSALF